MVCIEKDRKLEETGRQPVLVFTDGNRTMGLIVDEIIDIVEDHLNIELSSDRVGYLGTAVIASKATDVIDASHYLTLAYPDWFSTNNNQAQNGDSTRVLLVDDSPFFRNLLQPLLTVSGYNVVSVDSAEAALALCDAGENFDVIVSDIEMPGMNGFELATYIKSETRWSDTPLVALSSYTNPRDLELGRKAGFVDYVSKTDREALLNTLNETLAEAKKAAA